MVIFSVSVHTSYYEVEYVGDEIVKKSYKDITPEIMDFIRNNEVDSVTPDCVTYSRDATLAKELETK